MDNMLKLIKMSINNLFEWIDHRYEGWDPYDGLNSMRFNNFQSFPQMLKIGVIQINRISPINFRPILSISPGVDMKGSSIFLQAYCKLFDLGFHNPLEEDGLFLYSKLIDEEILNNDTISWSSHYFNHIGHDGSILTPNTPDLIGTTNAIRAICQYTNRRQSNIDKIIEKYYNFLMSNFDYDHSRFRYSHYIQNKYIPNCDAEVISSIRYTKRIVDNPAINKICLTSLEKLIECQNDDGSWYYSYYNDGRKYTQLDFHQGYIINGLIDSINIFPEMENEILRSLKKAVDSYDTLFSPDGRGYYRYPRKYPTDIHNQAQGIITYLKLYNLYNNNKFYFKSEDICKWTIENMQHPSGYYYYQKGRLLTNKIPYMRWSQAWMMLALSHILESVIKRNE